MAKLSKIYPCLWFDSNAEEAAKFYTSIFKDSKILNVAKYPQGSADNPANKPDGSVMTVEFELEGQRFLALNGGPVFKFSEAISLVVDCEDQAEVDYFWEKLLAGGGEESQCGWLKDKFGLSWQVAPKRINELYSDPDPVKVKRVFEAMMKMVKLDIAKLERAYEGN